jgi:hypothetical protein
MIVSIIAGRSGSISGFARRSKIVECPKVFIAAVFIFRTRMKALPLISSAKEHV